MLQRAVHARCDGTNKQRSCKHWPRLLNGTSQSVASFCARRVPAATWHACHKFRRPSPSTRRRQLRFVWPRELGWSHFMTSLVSHGRHKRPGCLYSLVHRLPYKLGAVHWRRVLLGCGGGQRRVYGSWRVGCARPACGAHSKADAADPAVELDSNSALRNGLGGVGVGGRNCGVQPLLA